MSAKRRLRELNLKYAMLYPAELKADNRSHFFTSAQDVVGWLESRPRGSPRITRWPRYLNDVLTLPAKDCDIANNLHCFDLYTYISFECVLVGFKLSLVYYCYLTEHLLCSSLFCKCSFSLF